MSTPQHTESAKPVKRDRTHYLYIAVIVAVLAGTFFSPVPRLVISRSHDTARAVSCRSNLKQLTLAMMMYTDDHDERFPPPASSLDLAGVNYDRFEEARRDPLAFGMAVLGDGVIHDYLRNQSNWYCPADDSWRHARGGYRTDFLPEPGLSYRWNVGLAGKSAEDVGDPGAVPVLFDRRPIHRKQRNVAFADLHVQPLHESKWEELGIEGR